MAQDAQGPYPPNIDSAMHSTYLAQVHEHYCKVSGSTLTVEQFEHIVSFFPCLLVISSDGVIDQDEWVYVQYLAKFMAESHDSELKDLALSSLQQSYYKELSFLIDHLSEWKDEMVGALREYVKEYPEMKDIVLDTLFLFADASEGTSDTEEAQIDAILKSLGFDQE